PAFGRTVPPALPLAFPTRRSSDLAVVLELDGHLAALDLDFLLLGAVLRVPGHHLVLAVRHLLDGEAAVVAAHGVEGVVGRHDERSEEPRLNSSHVKISYAVFCLTN